MTRRLRASCNFSTCLIISTTLFQYVATSHTIKSGTILLFLQAVLRLAQIVGLLTIRLARFCSWYNDAQVGIRFDCYNHSLLSQQTSQGLCWRKSWQVEQMYHWPLWQCLQQRQHCSLPLICQPHPQHPRQIYPPCPGHRYRVWQAQHCLQPPLLHR